MDVTVLKLEFPEAQFNAPFSGTQSDERDDEAGGGVADEPEDDSGGGMSAIVGLGVLVGLAALAWYLRSGGGPETEPYPEDVAPEEHA